MEKNGKTLAKAQILLLSRGSRYFSVFIHQSVTFKAVAREFVVTTWHLLLLLLSSNYCTYSTFIRLLQNVRSFYGINSQSEMRIFFFDVIQKEEFSLKLHHSDVCVCTRHTQSTKRDDTR